MKKFLQPSFELIDYLKSEHEFTIEGGSAFMEGKTAYITKKEKLFEINFKVAEADKKYINDIDTTKAKSAILKGNSDKDLYLPNKSIIYLKKSEITNTLDFNYDFDVIGPINKILSTPESKIDDHFYRLIIPIESQDNIFQDFQRTGFVSDVKLDKKSLIEVVIGQNEFHFMHFEFNKCHYWGVDSLQKHSFKEFQEISFSILNAYGFLKGKFF